MTTWDVVVLAFVQGVTEFLPVSSSGHLVLARALLGIEDANGTAFDAFLHLGTLLAVLWYYRATWWQLGRVFLEPRAAAPEQRQLLALLAVATVPAAVAGWGLHEAADAWRSTTMVGAGLLMTAVFLLVSEVKNLKLKSQKLKKWKPHLASPQNEGRDKPLAPAALGEVRSYVRPLLKGRGELAPDASVVTWRAAIGVGLAQVMALLPGISRSGSTIAAGQLLGLPRAEAVRFSFLLSAPIIAGAGLSMVGSVVGDGFSAWQLALALTVAFGSGLAAIAGLTRWVERSSLVPFALYLILVGGVVLVL